MGEKAVLDGQISSDVISEKDRKYLDGYFKVCALVNDKRTLIRKLNALLSDDVNCGALRTVSPLREKLRKIDRRIKLMDAHFWEMVAKEQDEAKYNFERFCQEKRLGLYEKRVLLYLLYLEFNRIMKNVCYQDELLELFDWDGSIFNRIRDNRYFREDAPLIKLGYIAMYSRKSASSARIDYSLTNKAVDEITSAFIHGQTEASEIVPKQANMDCGGIGRLTDPMVSMDDVVLKSEIKEQVKFLLESLGNKRIEALGLKAGLIKNKGLIFLFYGPPGTGKSMLAEAVAKYIKKKVLMVEIPKITSRWFGDTDKNISKMFSTAQESNALLCFDEADSLLYNRSYASQEHDIRFVNVMLQELDRFEGVAVLTTNMDTLLDPALERRVSLKVKFELPDMPMRQRMWREHIPSGVKLAKDVKFDELARRYSFSGGYIRNAVMNAIRKYALNKKGTLTMQDLVFAADMEKAGMFVEGNHKLPMGFVQCG